MTRATLLRVAAPVIVFLALYLCWQWVALTYHSILPPFGAVLAEFAARPAFYLSNLAVTVYAAMIGFVIAGVAAILLAILMVYFDFLRAAIIPVALLLNVTPIVAVSPALIVAFGFNAIPHIIVAGIAAFFPMLINAMTGLSKVDPEMLDVFDAMSASRREVFFRLRLPGSLGSLFAGMKLSLTAAMVGSIVSEFMGTAKGIGATIVMATAYLNLPQMWVAIFVSALTTLGLIGIATLLERAIIRW